MNETTTLAASQDKLSESASPSIAADAALPLSPTQKLCEASRVPQEQGVNIEQVVCRTSEGLDLAALRKAWEIIFERHPVLRFRIVSDGPEPRQEVVSPLDLPFQVEDHAKIPAPERDALIERWLEKDRQRSFDLSVAPLMRVTVLNFGPGIDAWIWTFHRILLDVRSILLVLDEVFAAYDAIRRGATPELPAHRPFAEYLAWQQAWYTAHQGAAESFWRELYTNAESETKSELIIRKAAAQQGDYRRAILRLPTDGSLTLKFQRATTQLGVSVNTIVQGAWALLLSRHYRCPQVTFSTVRACRRGSADGAETMVGMLMNSLPVHARVAGTTVVADLLKALASQQFLARAFQSTPWDCLLQALPVAAARQLAESCVLCERYDLVEEMAARYGQGGTRTFSYHDRVNLPLILSVSEQPEVRFELRYQTALFAAEDIELLAADFLAILEEILANPEVAIGELKSVKAAAGLTPAQRERRRRYNDTAGEPVVGLLHAGFFANSRTQPDLLAVDDGARRLTYGELAGYAWSVARRLRAAGVTEGTLVGVAMEKGWEPIAAVLGILRAGAAYLPLDPNQPKARIEYLLGNGQVKIVLTQERLRSTVSWPADVQVWTVDEALNPEPFEGGEPRPGALAYVIYTSGSTGQPKGVMIAHQAALNTNVDINRRLEVTAKDRVLAVSALTFDLSVYDIFGLLDAGGAIIMPSQERARDPLHWLDRIQQCGVTIWNSAPALMQMLVTVLETSTAPAPVSLRWVMMSGDWIPVDLPDRIHKFSPNCRLLSLGGATEVSIWSIAFPIDKVDPSWASIPYGMPLTNQTIHVLDENFEPCPELVTGEIFIGGVGLALGYWADPVKTADRFVRSPVTGEALYRTGDFGRFRPEGWVEFLGRKDTQVKIRGHRIEIGEIEAALLRLDNVREAAALTVKDERGTLVLVGCLVRELNNGAAPVDPAAEEHSVRTKLGDLLVNYMIPSRIILLDKLPLSSNGKVDRNALAEVVRPQLSSQKTEPEEEPQDHLERAIWNIWRGILPGQRIGTRDRFFDLGGDSMTVLQMMVRVEKFVGRPIGLHSLRGGGRIVDIAAAARNTGPVPTPSLLECTQLGGSRPRLFFAHGDLGNGGLYCQRLARELGPDQPLYAITPHGTFGDELPDTFVQAASDYVKLIRSVQPHGPYHLGGYCNGATGMYEVTRQLRAAGETVASLILLDPPDLYFHLTRAWFVAVGNRIGLNRHRGRALLHRLAELTVSLQYHFNFQFFYAKLRARWEEYLQNLKCPPDPGNVARHNEMLRLNDHYVELISEYNMEPMPDSKCVCIILRHDDPKLCQQQRLRWGRYVPEASYASISGDHLELKKCVKEVAAIVTATLDAATPPVPAAANGSDGKSHRAEASGAS